MNDISRIIILSFSLILFAGCSTTITNLTPSQLPRADSALYPLDAHWELPRKEILEDSIQPYAVVEMEQYLMKRTPHVEDRWETVIPIPPEKNYIDYYFKIDYNYHGFGVIKHNSVASDPYSLKISAP
jgi:hypothetical protein